MNTENLITWLNINPMLIIKPFLIVILFLHLLFALVLVRQTKLMLEIIEAKISPTIMGISLVHAAISFLILLLVFIFF